MDEYKLMSNTAGTTAAIRNLLLLDSVPSAQTRLMTDKILSTPAAVSAEDLRDVFSLFLDIYEIRFSPAGIAHAVGGLKDIIDAACEILAVNETIADGAVSR